MHVYYIHYVAEYIKFQSFYQGSLDRQVLLAQEENVVSLEPQEVLELQVH